MALAKKLWRSLQSSIEAGDRGFATQDFVEQDKIALSMQRSYLFLSDTEFEKEFHAKPTQCGIRSDVLKSESGHSISGVILQDEKSPYRTLVMSHSAQTTLSTLRHSSQHQLRAGQGADFAEQWQLESAKSLPPSLDLSFLLQK